MHLELHSVNRKSISSSHRVVYLWCSMLWLISMCGASIVTKRNVVSTIIPLIFLWKRDDVQHSRFCTSEAIEHTFGNNRLIFREFTVLNFSQLVEKQVRRHKLMYKHNLNQSRDPQKGYQATYADFYEYSISTGSEDRLDKNIELFHGGDFIAKELWSTVSKLISHSNDIMQNILKAVGVPEKEMSPFCRKFTSLIDLRDEYIKFCPETFKYGKVVGAEEVISEDLRYDKTKLINDVVIKRIAQFASYMNDTSNIKVNETRTSKSEHEKKQIDVITTKNNTKINCNTLMSHFKALLLIDSPNELLAKVSDASACLSGICTVQGALGFDRKVKSLLRRWTTKVAGVTTKKNINPIIENSILIKRDTIVLLDVKTGIGSDTSIVTKPFRVVTIYDNFF